MFSPPATKALKPGGRRMEFSPPTIVMLAFRLLAEKTPSSGNWIGPSTPGENSILRHLDLAVEYITKKIFLQHTVTGR
jgi:hypothetical protein